MRACLAFLLAAALPAFAAIIDRTAIAVGDKVITDSDITRRIRLAAFQNGELPDFSLASRREAAQRLIDLRLVEREMDLGHYERTPPAKAAEMLAAFTAEHYQSSAEALRLSLATMDLTPADLQAEFAEQADLLSFTNLRFRPSVEISDQEIQEYYGNHIQSPTAPSLADERASIERILTNERADLDLDAWLQGQRKNTTITYLEKDLA